MTEKRPALIWKETGGRCVYCAEATPQDQRSLDHVHPKSWGGRDHTDNLVPACKSCNERRGLVYPPSTLAHPDFVVYVQAKERAQEPLANSPLNKISRQLKRQKIPMEKAMCFFKGGHVSSGQRGITVHLNGQEVAQIGWPDIGNAFTQNFTVE